MKYSANDTVTVTQKSQNESTNRFNKYVAWLHCQCVIPKLPLPQKIIRIGGCLVICSV